jgi:N-methylhydantoinase A
MGIREVVIPPTPSVFCAAGCLVAEVVHDAVRSLHTRSPDLAAEFGQLAAQVGQWLDGQIDPAWLLGRRVERYAAMRYAGQSFQLDVALGENDGVAEAAAAFHREHLRLYAHADEANPVEFIELRARIIGALPAPTNIPAGTIQRELAARPYTTRAIRLDGALHPSVPIYRREELGEGSRVAGPAIIEQSDTTILVPAQFVAQTGVAGELRLVRTH